MCQKATRLNVCAIIATIASLVAAPACTTTNDDNGPILGAAPSAMEKSPPSPDPTEVAKTNDPGSPAFALRSLERVTAGHPELSADVSDIHALLNAANKSALGDKAGAQAAWFEALTLARSGFGKMALEGWLKAYTDNLGRTSDPMVLARLIAAETRNGSVSPYMIGKGLTSDEAILQVLRTTVPQWLTADPTATQARPESKFPVPQPPASATLPSDDPVLRKTAMKVCKAHAQTAAAWTNWSASLSDDVRAYWQALLTDLCGSGTNLAIQSYQQVYPKLAAGPETLAMAIEAAGRLAALQRANGLRTEAAATYSELVGLWAIEGLPAGAFGLDIHAQTLRRIDETLWAARYRSLVGDYEHAKIYAQSALDQTKLMAVKRNQLKPSVREQLASLKADAYHTLAFRVAVEQHQFTSALSLTLLSLDTPDLSKEWQERLTWAAGLYDYLDGNFANARQRWQGLLSRTHEDSLQAALKFWLARVSAKLGDNAGAKTQMIALIRQYPLSYYSVVAGHEAGLQDGPAWLVPFGSLQGLNRTLVPPRDFRLQALRQSAILRPLLSRAEVLTAANLGPFARAAVNELEQALAPGGDIQQKSLLYVYLSRLHFRAGNYLAAINLTTKLAKHDPGFWAAWPDQLLINFARPFSAEYSYSAESSGVAKAVLLGISRQESGFTPDIRSSANALGLMQLIPPTARRFAGQLGLHSDPIEDLLKDPATNIRIGAHYLKFLGGHFKNFPPAIYAGYNAGEYAVDLWLRRRAHSDPLAFIELIPFGETKDYVKGVWRNVIIYSEIEKAGLTQEQPGFDLGFAGVVGA